MPAASPAEGAAAAAGCRYSGHARRIFLDLFEAGCGDRWKQVGALYLVLGACRGDVECSDPRIRVVLECQFNQFLQPWVGEKFAPANVARRGGRRRALAGLHRCCGERWAARPLFALRHFRTLIVRLERATTDSC